MTSNVAGPKGILKKSTGSQKETTVDDRSSRDVREISLQHAHILQHRKELEKQILENLIRLSEYPLVRSTTRSAANPAPSDVSEFKSLVRLFQPGDYDDLIEERNANNLCGYTLCARQRARFSGSGSWKLVNAGKKGFDIVQRKDIERWCSGQCARRALYVKVQLNETAAWERAGMPCIEIELLNEEDIEVDHVARTLGQTTLSEDCKTTPIIEPLALERGDLPSTTTDPRVQVTIRAKEIASPPATNSAFDNGDHLRLEGYRPKTETL